MRIYQIPLDNVISINRIVQVESTDDEKEEGSPFDEAPDGRYALDSEGQIWKLQKGVTGFLHALDFDEPQLKRERKEARAKRPKRKRKRHRVV